MKPSKVLVFLLIYTALFFVVLSIIDALFFVNHTSYLAEEKYIEKSNTKGDELSIVTERDRQVANNILKEEKDKIKKNNTVKKFLITYVPEEIRIDTTQYSEIVSHLFSFPNFGSKISFLSIQFFKDRFDIRGKLQKSSIKMYGVPLFPYDEFIGVLIHEFGHYLDLYYLLEASGDKDDSNVFYNISWQDTSILKAGLQKSDFVSGYAMTNKYEDLAESFTYYILHNDDFLYKSQKSTFLKEKYDFFGRYLFPSKEFVGTNFSTDKNVKEYYWDITKIKINYEYFLQYLNK